MSNVVELNAYRTNKQNLLGKVEEDFPQARASYYAAACEQGLREYGFSRARVMFHNSSYVVVLGCSIWQFVMCYLPEFFTTGQSFDARLEYILRRLDANTKKVVVMRAWPSEKNAAKILRQLS